MINEVNFTMIMLTSISSAMFDHFGTKTSYFFTGSKDDREIHLLGCKPVIFWFLARHGARNPSKGDMRLLSPGLPLLKSRLVKAWSDGKSSFDAEEISYMKAWQWNFEIGEESFLFRSGELEQFQIGLRWRNRLASLQINMEQFEVRSSRQQRSRESATFFLDGFLHKKEKEKDVELCLTLNKERFLRDYFNPGENHQKVESSKIQIDDWLLRFHENCPKWKAQVRQSDKAKIELAAFIRSQAFSGLLDRVIRMTGFNITVDDTFLLWQMCRYEVAWKPGSYIPWCKPFTNEDLKIFEFWEDLNYYYRNGPGFDVTSDMTQPLWQDIVMQLDRKEVPKVILNFGHEDTVMPLLTSMGLYRDQHDLTANDWPTKQYLWKTSKVGAFSSNVGILVFDCSGKGKCSKEENVMNQWKVMVFHQEQPVKIAACDGMVCPLEVFLDAFKHLALIDFNSTCSF